MGNLLQPSKSSYFLSEVSSSLHYLTNCILNLGSISNILLVQQRLTKIQMLHSTFVDPVHLKGLFKKTPLEGCESILVSNFVCRPSHRINIMEVLASLITYARCNWDEKVKLAIEVFDFDENHVITYEEMLMMCKSFINGVGIMTQSALYSKATLETLADQAFILADATPDGRVTYEELLDWVKNSEILFNLLMTNQPEKERTKTKRVSIIEQIGFEITSNGPSIFPETKRSTARHKTEPKKASYKKPVETDEVLLEIEEIFKTLGNSRRRMMVRNLFEAISASKVLAGQSHNIINDLKLRVNSEVSLEEVRNALVKRRSIRLMSDGKGKTGDEAGVVKNLAVLRTLFDSYDTNKDGSISLQELRLGLRDKFSAQSIEEMFKEYDSDGNGVLDFTEFVRLFSPDGAVIPD